ncbi:MAG: chemotaxis protein CheD [Ruminococcus sp.]|nr:chemotaxis protein CheD [Ruminococcus sp.]MCM1479013.1 chemotaxis protein CheD [Muribaculaceae bacterium]
MVTVGIADLNVVKSPDSLITYALGSCVGICLYDSDRKIAGLAHIMLPLSTEAGGGADNKRRYADTGIAELVQMMSQAGAVQSRLTAKIAGGAQMFKGNSSAMFNIGERNVAAVKKVLASYRIRIIAEETGADFGRTVVFHGDDGKMEIRAAMKPTKFV